MKNLSKAFSYLLILFSIGMLVWGVLGFIEYFSGLALVLPLQNPTFPRGTQFIHWLLITLAGATYLVGYKLRWQYTPLAMILLFSMLATMCFIQTFDFMVNPGRFVSFTIECVMYITMSTYLLCSQLMQQHFGKLVING